MNPILQPTSMSAGITQQSDISFKYCRTLALRIYQDCCQVSIESHKPWHARGALQTSPRANHEEKKKTPENPQKKNHNHQYISHQHGIYRLSFYEGMKNRVDVYGTGRSHRAAQLSFPPALLSSVSDMCCTPVLLPLRPVASFIQVTNWICFDCLLNFKQNFTSHTLSYLDYDCDWIRQFFFSTSCSRYLLLVALCSKATLPGTGWAWVGFGVVMSSLQFIYLLFNVFAFFFYYL